MFVFDGEYQAAIYDVAVLPNNQGKGIGKLIIQTIVKNIPHCNFILYAFPGLQGVNGVWLAVPVAELVSLAMAIAFIVKNRKHYHYA